MRAGSFGICVVASPTEERVHGNHMHALRKCTTNHFPYKKSLAYTEKKRLMYVHFRKQHAVERVAPFVANVFTKMVVVEVATERTN